MNAPLVRAVADLAFGLLGNPQEAETTVLLVQMVQKSVKALEDHTGEPMDPALIRPEPLL